MSPERLLEKLLSQGRECPWVEYKTNYDGQGQLHEYIGEYLSGLANSAANHEQEKGYIVWGIKDQSLAVVGTRFRPYAEKSKVGSESLENWLVRSLNPHCDFRIHEFEVQSKHIVIFEIDRARTAPVKFKSKAFIRVDSYLQNLQKFPELERKLWQLDPNDDWSAKICNGAGLVDLDSQAIAKARIEFKEKNPRFADEVESWDNETFLNKAKFCINGKITRTAIILLGKPESEHYLSPAIAQMSWILKDKDNIEIDYEHFGPPFLLNAERLFAKIRNLRYRYMPEGTLFPREVDQYDQWVIRESLHNCIAHQDYTKAGRINVVEMPEKLIFSNLGEFIPGSVEEVIRRDSPEEIYRNRFLANAMVNCQMIDTIGSGIKKMFITQKNRYFPMPGYKITTGLKPKVTLKIDGKVLDLAYAKILLSNPEIDIETTILLDKVQRKERLLKEQIAYLRKKKLIEGRSPNIYIAASVAEKTGQKADYIKNRGLDDKFYKQCIVEHIKKFGGSSRSDIDALILKQLPDFFVEDQKKKKVDNLLYSLKKEEVIFNENRLWKLKK
ncbi:MAG: putative DNA binding domain-containing protein [Phycisphaerae bacterium]|nr:putative DNA binding domain-containing protein [Phycisphaerae bacterium]